MQKFQKKPAVIEAMQFTDLGCVKAIEKWAGSHVMIGEGEAAGYIHIATLEGTMTARIGDWIIRGVKGEFYPCKPDIFEATYTPDVGFGFE